MKTKIILKETKEIVAQPNLEIIPRIGEKIYHNDLLFKVTDIIHTADQINLFVRQVDSEHQDYDVIW
ncbi:hypothetical protein ACKGJY_15280 [Hyunsoonleella sp. 2307UL5-6]|uniref:hypothetical protein n=1 Tax=Hyunsoonleella sp. 2307UL5-6 TaxID=3384768 RepID=UPI0039BD4886